MSDTLHDDLLNYHDDNRAMRDVLHNVHGASPVSGGVLGDILEEEAREAEESAMAAEDMEFDSDIVV